MQFGGETTIIEMVRSNKGKESIMGLLEGLESCVESGWKSEQIGRPINEEVANMKTAQPFWENCFEMRIWELVESI